MIDIHCHVLPAISGDDGSNDLKSAESMLTLASQEGITALFCTPHFSQKGMNDVPDSMSVLKPLAEKKNIRLYSGTEYKFLNLLDKKSEDIVTLGDSKFVLVDFAMNSLPPSSEKISYDLHSNGYHLIAAHPERLFNNNNDFERLINIGYYFQITAGVLLGKFGKAHMNQAYNLIASGYCHYIASDAHGEHRPFHMQACRQQLTKRFGENFTRLVFETNPQRILENKLPLNPAPHKRNLKQLISDTFFC